MNYIRITKENIDKEHICCAMSGKQSVAKKEWLKQRFEDGLVFYRSEERGKCFIEYIPAENAWAPIEADGYADSVVRRVRYCTTDPDGAGSAADCANDLFLLRQYARDVCDEPRRSDLPCRYGTPHQTRCLPQESLHSLPDAVIFVYPRFGRFYDALRVSTRKTAAHTISQARTSCSGERNAPIMPPLEDHLPYAVLEIHAQTTE